MMIDTHEEKHLNKEDNLAVVWGIGVINSILTISYLLGGGFSSSIGVDSFTLILWLIFLVVVFGDLYNTTYRIFGIVIAISSGIVLFSMIVRVLDVLEIIDAGYLTPREFINIFAIWLLIFGLILILTGIFYQNYGKHEDKYRPLVSLIVISFLLIGAFGVIAGYLILTSSLPFLEFEFLSASLINSFFALKVVPCSLAFISDLDVS